MKKGRVFVVGVRSWVVFKTLPTPAMEIMSFTKVFVPQRVLRVSKEYDRAKKCACSQGIPVQVRHVICVVARNDRLTVLLLLRIVCLRARESHA